MKNFVKKYGSIFFIVCLFFIANSSFAQSSIYSRIEYKYSLIGRNPKVATVLTLNRSPINYFFANAWDTVSSLSRTVNWNYFVQTINAGNTPLSYLRIRYETGNLNLVDFYSDGSTRFLNGLILNTTGSSSRIFSSGQILQQSNVATGIQNRVAHATGFQNIGTVWQVDLSGASVPYTSSLIRAIGSNTDTSFIVKASSQIGVGTASIDSLAIAEYRARGRGVLLPRLTTTQRNTMKNYIKQINVTSPGSNFTLTPTITIAQSNNGRVARAFATLSAGGISSITVTDGGSGYNGAVSITVTPNPLEPIPPTLPVLTAVLDSSRIPAGLVIYNTDSSCIEFYNSTQWITVCGSGGGGGSSDTLFAQYPIKYRDTTNGNQIIYLDSNYVQGITDSFAAINDSITRLQLQVDSLKQGLNLGYKEAYYYLQLNGSSAPTVLYSKLVGDWSGSDLQWKNPGGDATIRLEDDNATDPFTLNKTFVSISGSTVSASEALMIGISDINGVNSIELTSFDDTVNPLPSSNKIFIHIKVFD